MADVFNLIRYNIVNTLLRMDMISIYNSFSLLDFFVALLIFGAVLPVFVITVNNWGQTFVRSTEVRGRKSNDDKK